MEEKKVSKKKEKKKKRRKYLSTKLTFPEGKFLRFFLSTRGLLEKLFMQYSYFLKNSFFEISSSWLKFLIRKIQSRFHMHTKKRKFHIIIHYWNNTLNIFYRIKLHKIFRVGLTEGKFSFSIFFHFFQALNELFYLGKLQNKKKKMYTFLFTVTYFIYLHSI